MREFEAGQMDVGFDTIGNATLICYDRVPTLVTDPWITDSAYFGSWTLPYVVPDEQMEAIKACQYVWISHAHPDHLNAGSFNLFRGKRILLPDHQGGRIRNDLVEQGCHVQVLENGVWLKVSDRIKLLCISDYNQDAILLVDINGRLIVNTNDASDLGWSRFVRKIIKHYPISFLLALSGFGDSDMINFYGEDGVAIPPSSAKKIPVGRSIAQLTGSYDTKYFIPFSSMHRYQREDSVWANQYITTLADHSVGFESKTTQLLPAFIRYDCAHDTFKEINPPKTPERILPPEQFGDNWNEQLEREDVSQIDKYFKAISHLEKVLDFINVRVGGKDNIIAFKANAFKRGITFEVPRHSLMVTIKHEIFDDLLIGNFMRTTLHGKWPKSNLYPDFTPFVTKYADNGRAKTEEEVELYFDAYKRRSLEDFLIQRFEKKSREIFRRYVGKDSQIDRVAKRAYWILKKCEGKL